MVPALWYEHCVPWLHSHIAQEKLGFPEQTGILFLPMAAPCSPPALGLARGWLCSSRKMGLTAHGAKLCCLGPWSSPCLCPSHWSWLSNKHCLWAVSLPCLGFGWSGQFPSVFSEALGLYREEEDPSYPRVVGCLGHQWAQGRAEVLLTPWLSILLPQGRARQGQEEGAYSSATFSVAAGIGDSSWFCYSGTSCHWITITCVSGVGFIYILQSCLSFTLHWLGLSEVNYWVHWSVQFYFNWGEAYPVRGLGSSPISTAPPSEHTPRARAWSVPSAMRRCSVVQRYLKLMSTPAVKHVFKCILGGKNRSD